MEINGYKIEPGANLAGADLSGADLSGAYMKTAGTNTGCSYRNETGTGWIYFYGIDLSNARLVDANLTGANLRCANLSGTDLTGADLSDADLYHANLTNVNMTRTIFYGAYLGYVNLTNAINFRLIYEEDLSCATLPNGKIHPKVKDRSDFCLRELISDNKSIQESIKPDGYMGKSWDVG